jgi:hypothetical protein
VKQFRDLEEGIVGWFARELQMLRHDGFPKRTRIDFRSYSRSPGRQELLNRNRAPAVTGSAQTQARN